MYTQQNIVYHLCLLCFMFLFCGTIQALPHHRFRRQLNVRDNHGSSVLERATRLKNPSGSIPGTAYYGVGSDPNYGSFISSANRPNGGGVFAISYDPNSSLNGYLINPSHQQHQQAQQQNTMYNNNAWSRPNSNGYYNQPYGRYAPGSQGWYATGGNYWYNNGRSMTTQPCLLIVSTFILIISK